jgi:hypothetical protein
MVYNGNLNRPRLRLLQRDSKQDCVVYSSGGWKSKIWVPAWLGSDEGSDEGSDVSSHCVLNEPEKDHRALWGPFL